MGGEVEIELLSYLSSLHRISILNSKENGTIYAMMID